MEGRHGSKESLAIGREGLKPIYDFVDMAADQDKPFFLWYGVFLPHTPHNPPARLLNKYKKEGRALDVAKYYAMCASLDSLLEISVLPTPVGPIIKMFFGKTSFFISPSKACLLHLFLKAIATAFFALF